jgi:hypothetical protein
MYKKVLFLLLGLIPFVVLLNAQPQVIPNEVTLYLSNGDIKAGLLIEIKTEVSPKNRVLVIWTHSDGYITYPVQDIEALTQNYTREQVARDLSGLKWREEKDYFVLIKPSTGQQTDLIKGRFMDYHNIKGIYYNLKQEYKWKEVGAIYFFNYNHSHFTSLPNEFAQQPTLVKNVVPDVTVTNSKKEILEKRHQRRRDDVESNIVDTDSEILKLRPQRRPDVLINLPASQPLFRSNNVNAGERYYIEVEGAIKINPSIEVGTSGYGGEIAMRYKPEAATGVPLVFIAPQGDFHIKVPAAIELAVLKPQNLYIIPKYGSLCFTINDSYHKDNSGSFQIKLWKFDQ